MLEVNDFVDAARLLANDAHLIVPADGSPVRTRTGRAARWIGRLEKTANRRTVWVFVESLRVRYGNGAADLLDRRFGLDGSLRNGKPLKARTVRDIVFVADRITARAPAPDAPVPAPDADRFSGFAPQLACELRRALQRKFVAGVIVAGDPLCQRPVSEEAFFQVVTEFNAAMEDLHSRFPKLREIEPPTLSQRDARTFMTGATGVYALRTATIHVRDSDNFEAHGERIVRERRRRSGYAPCIGGLRGVLMHEYAHHLSLRKPHAPATWLPRLAAMLRQSGLVSDETGIDTTDVYSNSLSIRLGKKAREIGMGTYAGTDATEFAAEALAWRMSPGYGASSDIPRMPRCLEDWVHECFPFTMDGTIPASCHEFDPASVREPAMVGGRVTWRDRGRAPVPPPRE